MSDNDTNENQNQSTTKMAPEVAEAEFTRFAELWDIDVDETSMSEDDLEGFEKLKRPLVRGFAGGWVTLDDEGILTVALRHSKNVDYDTLSLDPSKADVLSMDKYKDRQNQHKIKAYMGTMARKPVKLLAGIDPRDEKYLRGAILLFLAS